MKNEHDLRGARFALEQTDFADFIKISRDSKWLRPDDCRLRSFRFAATSEEKCNRNQKQRTLEKIHLFIAENRRRYLFPSSHCHADSIARLADFVSVHNCPCSVCEIAFAR